ncbi:hypothetical protein SAY86_023810 [Trapa natans]|uniref:Uncharacterized protein n=1 Tax=Trapa natans TaxID=22666 RepID=A0AAN7MBB7_TRANT|nr:hypothetical protein SAY86_023810 [Trapa natans]
MAVGLVLNGVIVKAHCITLDHGHSICFICFRSPTGMERGFYAYCGARVFLNGIMLILTGDPCL